VKKQYQPVIGLIVFLACVAVFATASLPPRAGAAPQGAPAGPYDEKADAARDISAALASARTDRKNVLLDFGANWCLDCVVLSKIFDDKSLKPYLDANFHVVKIDIGRGEKNQDLVRKYGNPIAKGVPAVVVLDPAERIVASTKGGELESARSASVEDILAYLKKWAPR
jgi:thiol:disulfide interchange protein